MRGAHHRTAGGAVRLDHRAEQLFAGGVERRQRFVKQPDPSTAGRQPRQSRAPKLAGGQRRAQVVPSAAQVHAAQGVVDAGALSVAAHVRQPAQILDWREALAYAGLVPHIVDGAVPPHATAPRREQAGQAAQQRAFAAAVRPAHCNEIAGRGDEPQLVEQHALGNSAGQALSGK